MEGGEGCQWRVECGAGISGELGPFLLVERMNLLFYHSPDFSSRDIAHSLVPVVRKMETCQEAQTWNSICGPLQVKGWSQRMDHHVGNSKRVKQAHLQETSQPLQSLGVLGLQLKNLLQEK